ncbi:MAG: hypothetical protein AAB686_01465, partial [Patescibacteria group bacterium]
MKYAKVIVVAAALSLLGLWLPDVHGFEATSTSFEVHAGLVGTLASSTVSSTSFKLTSAGGQIATTTMTSASRQLFSGILHWLYALFTPSYEQIHYRWRNDNGTESTATFPILEDVQYNSFPKDTILRLRLEVSNEGWTRGSGQQFRIEYAETTNCSAGSYTAVPTGSALHWRMATSTYLTDGEATTNVAGGLTDMNAAFAASQVKTTGNMTSATTVTSENFTEVEYALVATSNATDSGTYCFRLTNNGSTANFVYSQYAKAVLSAGSTPGTPGIPSYSNVSTSTLTVSWT